MAIAKHGIFGHQNGRVGPVVFYTLNGQHVCRMIGRYIDEAKGGQIINREEMSVTMKFTSPLQEFIKCGFGVEARGTTKNAANLAVSHTKKHALKRDNGIIKIDHTKVVLSRGVLPSTIETSFNKVKGGVMVNWDRSCSNGAFGSDMVMIALCYPESGGASVHLNAANRHAAEVFLPVHKKHADEPVEAYLFFRSADGNRVSDSIYLGNLNGKPLTTEERAQYELATISLAISRANFEKQQDKFTATGKKTKAYRDLEKECEVWRSRIFELTGNPG